MSTPRDTALHTHESLAVQTQEKLPDSINYWAGKGEDTIHASRLVCCQGREMGKQRDAQEPSEEWEGRRKQDVENGEI